MAAQHGTLNGGKKDLEWQRIAWFKVPLAALPIQVPRAVIWSPMLRCHLRSLKTKFYTKILKFREFTDPSNQNEQLHIPLLSKIWDFRERIIWRIIPLTYLFSPLKSCFQNPWLPCYLLDFHSPPISAQGRHWKKKTHLSIFTFISVLLCALLHESSKHCPSIVFWQKKITSRKAHGLLKVCELGGELLVLEGVALLVEDLGHDGDQQQPLLGVSLGEADGLAGGQLQGGARRLLASQVPERFQIAGLSFWFICITHMADTRRSTWRAAFASTLRSSAWPSSWQPLGESRELVFSSVKNRREKLTMVVVMMMNRLTCW